LAKFDKKKYQVYTSTTVRSHFYCGYCLVSWLLTLQTLAFLLPAHLTVQWELPLHNQSV